MGSHRGFDLRSPNAQRYEASLHMDIGHPPISFREVSTRIPCPFFNWVLCLLNVEYSESVLAPASRSPCGTCLCAGLNLLEWMTGTRGPRAPEELLSDC